MPAREEVEPGRFYLNTGDWISHCTYVTIPVTGAPELRQWVGGSVEHGTGRPRARIARMMESLDIAPGHPAEDDPMRRSRAATMNGFF